MSDTDCKLLDYNNFFLEAVFKINNVIKICFERQAENLFYEQIDVRAKVKFIGIGVSNTKKQSS